MDDTVGRRCDRWPWAIFAAHLAHNLWFASRHPKFLWDPDLVAYFVYFRNWLAGDTGLRGVEYFTVPKPLLVFLLGPLGHPLPAFVLTALVSAALGVLVYLTVGRMLGRATGVLTALLLLLDVDRALLTVRSSSDLYVAALVFASIWCTLTRRYRLSAAAIGLAALAKPVALPCVLHLLAVDPPDRRRAALAVPIALLAVPAVAVANTALLGTPLGSPRFFAAFEAQHLGVAHGPAALVHFVSWVQLKQVIFGGTAVFGFVGLAAWLTADRRRLASPFLLVPCLLLAGYVAMSAVVPFVPISRFFWSIQPVFMAFIVWTMVESTRRVSGTKPVLHVALAGALACLLARDLGVRQLDYRRRAMRPFEDAMAFVERASPRLVAERQAGETVLTPIAFLPWFVRTLDDARRRPELVDIGEAADSAAQPDWIVYTPSVFLSPAVRRRFDGLVATGDYEARYVEGGAALLARRARETALDWSASAAD